MNETTSEVLKFNESLAFIQKHFGKNIPDCTLVLGSGLNDIIDLFDLEHTLSYEDIPHFPKSHVQGHAGQLHLGKIHGKTVLIFAGRFHYYQGHPNYVAAIPAWISGFWKIPVFMPTNASGGLHKAFKAGDMALIRDHIFLQSDHPLRGVSLKDWENPFVDMTIAYDQKLRDSISKIARSLKIKLKPAVYICVTGPTYETPSEIQAFHKMGADIVGMSTVSEVIVARRFGIRVLGISMVANTWSGLGKADEVLTHQEVVDSIAKCRVNLSKLLKAWFTEF